VPPLKTEGKPFRGGDYTCLDCAILLRRHLQQSFVQHPQLQIPRFPCRFLVTFHPGFAAIGTRVLERTTDLLDGAKDIHLTKDMFMHSILPIGLLFNGSLILSNTAYLYLRFSVWPTYKCLKCSLPVAILLISLSFRIQEPNRKLGVIVSPRITRRVAF
jgi:hypothetical protein